MLKLSFGSGREGCVTCVGILEEANKSVGALAESPHERVVLGKLELCTQYANRGRICQNSDVSSGGVAVSQQRDAAGAGGGARCVPRAARRKSGADRWCWYRGLARDTAGGRSKKQLAHISAKGGSGWGRASSPWFSPTWIFLSL